MSTDRPQNLVEGLIKAAFFEGIGKAVDAFGANTLNSAKDFVTNIPKSVASYPGEMLQGIKNVATDPIGSVGKSLSNPLGAALMIGFPAYSAYNMSKDEKLRKDPKAWGQLAGQTAGGLLTGGLGAQNSVLGTSGILPSVGMMLAGVHPALMGLGTAARWGLGRAGEAIGGMFAGPEAPQDQAAQGHQKLMKVWQYLDPSVQTALLEYGRRSGMNDEDLKKQVAEHLQTIQDQHHNK